MNIKVKCPTLLALKIEYNDEQNNDETIKCDILTWGENIGYWGAAWEGNIIHVGIRDSKCHSCHHKTFLLISASFQH